MGLLPSSSIGESTPVFEPIHGSWPQAKGLDIANPLAQVLSVAMLFEHFGLSKEGKVVREAVDASIKEGIVTPDLGEGGKSDYGTKSVGQWLSSWISSVEV